MNLLTLRKIKDQLRLEADDFAEDDYLCMLGTAAETAVQSHLNRTLYKTEVPDSDSTGLVIQDDIRMAMLMMCSHLYEHRETTVTGTTIAKVPMSYDFLLSPYRIIPV